MNKERWFASRSWREIEMNKCYINFYWYPPMDKTFQGKDFFSSKGQALSYAHSGGLKLAYIVNVRLK